MFTFNCAEQVMMTTKALLFRDFKMAQKIMATTDPNQHRLLGRNIQGFRDDVWDQNKQAIVQAITDLKFSQNEKLANLLLLTENKELVEAASWDSVWGIGMGIEHPTITNKSTWRGQNLLGLVLMETRRKLRLSSKIEVSSL